jgi:DNA-binding transcriptional ArsR family regulator
MNPGMSELGYPERDEIDLVTVLDALADPVRLEMFRIIANADGALACVEIQVPVSKSTGSHHLKVLREAGLVRAREAGTRRYYTVRRDDVDARFPGLLDAILRADARAESQPRS